MRNDKQKKRNLLQKWLTTHLPDNFSTLFDHQSKQYEITLEAERLFKEKDRQLGMSLYVVCLNDPISNPIPVYIGKSSALLNRWKNGHIKKLRDAYHKKTSGSYAKWIDLFDREDKIPFIICVDEKDVRFPPIPNFPITIGSIEYQLIALASDSYPDYLLNYEGKSR
jgi:hypothetical protein